MTDNNTPIVTVPATLWDGAQQLPGCLELWPAAVIFHPTDFKDGHLNLHIPLPSIKKVEAYLVFDLAKNGLRIEGQEGRFDLFVLDEVSRFKQLLIAEIGKLSG